MSKVRRKLETSAVRGQSSTHMVKHVNLYSKSLNLRDWSPNDALDALDNDALQKGRCSASAHTFSVPLTDAYSPAWHPSPRSGPPSQAFRPLLSLFLLRSKSTSSQPKHATISWENVTVPWEDILMGEWAKEGKDCKNSPEKSMFAFMPQLRTIGLSKRTDYLPLPVSPISTTLVHIIPLLEISSCQNPTHQNVHQYFGRAIWQTLAEMKMTHLWSSNSIFGKCPRNILAPEHKEICAKKMFATSLFERPRT